ncbi:MAG TPA: exodeoxyribonuclease VII small subunit [Clostridia bacterium]|nr:exodeoxyribonuclease VII small subunit [Clostridia bacterium]
MSIEQLLKKLNQIVTEMENQNVTIEKSLELFDEGVILAKQCFDSLDEYKGKLTVIKEKLDTIGK